MAQQIPVEDHALFSFEVPEEAVRELPPDLAYRRPTMVNVVFFGRPQADSVLIDTGLPAAMHFCKRYQSVFSMKTLSGSGL